MKIFLQDEFPGTSIDTSKWDVANTVTVESNEGVIQKTSGSTVGGSLTSKEKLPPNYIVHWDTHFKRNASAQSGAGFWYSQSVFMRKSNADWTQGENLQAYLSYHVDSNDTVIEVVFNLNHRAPGGVTEIGQVNIPLSLCDSIDIDGDGVLVRGLTLKLQANKIEVELGHSTLAHFIDMNPTHSNSPIQFGTGDGSSLATLDSIDNVLVTSI